MGFFRDLFRTQALKQNEQLTWKEYGFRELDKYREDHLIKVDQLIERIISSQEFEEEPAIETPANDEDTSVDTILEQMKEPRALPLGVAEFHVWSDRIISGSLLKADARSQKSALAEMLLHLSAVSDHECDGYFIKALRKSAINQIAIEIKSSLKAERIAEMKAEADLEKAKELLSTTQEQPGEVTAETIDGAVTDGETKA